MNVRYRGELSQAERDELTAMLSKGKRAARKLKRAQILLAADAGCSDEQIAREVAVGGSTVYRTKRRFVEGNLERALSEEPRPGAERKLTGKEEALLVATACASPPEGRARWTLELLAGAMVELTEHESLSSTTPQSMPAGSTWLRSRLAFFAASAWTVGSTIPGASSVKSPHGKNNETPPAPASIGCSQLKKPEPKWGMPIRSPPKSHNHCGEILVRSLQVL
jgi:transposase